jgi:hydrogenase-4 component B
VNATLPICAALVCAALSGVPGLVRRRVCGARTAAWLLGVAGALAVTAGALALGAPAIATAANASTPSPTPGWHPSLHLDALSSVFLFATGFVAIAAGWFSVGYWRDAEHPVAPWTRVFLGLLVAGVMGVVVAGDALTFLIAWEIMALASFALVATNHRDATARSAAWIYLLSTRAATLALIAAFVLMAHLTGGLDWRTLPATALAGAPGIAMILLFTCGFGLKAGMVPFHFWLPPAHAAAPSHVSAVMSGVLIKTGIYGLCRIASLMDVPPLWWGALIFAAGAVSAVLGVAWALGSHDLKRLLAYHSIENIGIILLGLGLALVGRSLDQPALVVLGLAGGLLHVLNHALFKSLLFLGAGAIDHACHTRSLDQLGGLSKRMPVTSACFLAGSAAICALPPFNGFVSEWLVYLGLFASASGAWPWALCGLLALVLTGGLALACFAKAAGIVFLGEPRTRAAAHAHETGPAERGAMIFLTALCLLIGVSLPLIAPLLACAVRAMAPGLPAHALAVLAPGAAWGISVAAAALMLGGAALWWWQRKQMSGVWGLGSGVVLTQETDAPTNGANLINATAGCPTPDPRPQTPDHRPDVGTWDCGYADPTARMQYTATSFAGPLTGELHAVLLPDQHLPHLRDAADAAARADRLFPASAAFSDHPRDPVLDRLLQPIGRAGAWCCLRLRVVHPGWIHLYLLYLAVTCFLLLLWSLA